MKKIILTLLFSLCLAWIYQDTFASLNIVGQDQEVVEFPDYFKRIATHFDDYFHASGPLDNPTWHADERMMFDSTTLKKLKVFIERLHSAARDPDGIEVSKGDISPDTIFLHSMVKENVRQMLDGFTPSDLGKWFEVSCQLHIAPLIDVFGFSIADHMRADAVDLRSPNARNEVTDQLKREGYVKDDFDSYYAKHVIKYLYLKRMGKEEFSIDDYIGTYGQPNPIQNNNGTGIHLSDSNLTSLQGINKIRNKAIKWLSLANNHLHDLDLPPHMTGGIRLFGQFQDLTKIDLSHNRLQSLPPLYFQGLITLQEIHLQHNEFQTLPKWMFNKLPALTEVHLEHNKISELCPSAFSEVPSLRKIHLDNNQLQTVLEGVFIHLPELKEIHLEHNRLQTLPALVFSQLPKLTEVHLEHNQISQLPYSAFYETRMVSKLDLSDNQLTSVPYGFLRNLPELYELDLSHNQLSSIDPGLFPKGNQLSSLKLQHNQLGGSLTDDFFRNLGGIRVLNLSNNQLTQLPDEFYRMLRDLMGIGSSYHYPDSEIHLEDNQLQSFSSDLLASSKFQNSKLHVYLERNAFKHRLPNYLHMKKYKPQYIHIEKKWRG